MPMLRWVLTLSALWLTSAAAVTGSLRAQTPVGVELRSLRVRLSWGHRSPQAAPWFVRLVPAANGMQIREAAGWNLEASDGVADGVGRTTAGAGDVDGVEFTLKYQEPAEAKRRTEHSIWNYLLTHSDADTASRLRNDPAFQVDPPLLTVQLNEEGTRGFSVSVEQLLRERAMWVPDLDVFLAAGDELITLEQHQAAIQPYAGQRILDQLEREPEATYEQYTAHWEDLGSPAYQNPHSVPPGHIVGVTWDSAIPKFGIDRWAGVASDYGNPDKFKFQLDLQGWEWKGQRLTDGLPVLRTTFERSAVRLEVEQFAYPLLGPPPERRGDIAMVLLQKVRATALDGTAQTVRLNLRHERSLPDAVGVVHLGPTAIVEETSSHRVLFSAQGVDTISDVTPTTKSVTAALVLNLPATGAKEIVLKLPSPLVEADARATLAGLDYAAARSATLRFWEDYLARGAQFRVPEQVVNDLFRATCGTLCVCRAGTAASNPACAWTCPTRTLPMTSAARPGRSTRRSTWTTCCTTSRLPRRLGRGTRGHLSEQPGVQRPRGRLCQLGRVHAVDAGRRGPAWSAFGRPGDHRRLAAGDAPSRGLVPGRDRPRPAGSRAYAGADRSALERPLARAQGVGLQSGVLLRRLRTAGAAAPPAAAPAPAEFQQAADQMRQAVERGFGQAAMRAPLVPLRDRTWIPYVPADASTPRRLLEVWYPTDVDTGPLHLSRLAALDPRGPLTTYLLHDHEDNLFLNGWGMANEPVYNQHATAYLRRDDVKPAIRAFYSMLACASAIRCWNPSSIAGAGASTSVRPAPTGPGSTSIATC